jgi:hypothetical protein
MTWTSSTIFTVYLHRRLFYKWHEKPAWVTLDRPKVNQTVVQEDRRSARYWEGIVNWGRHLISSLSRTGFVRFASLRCASSTTGRGLGADQDGSNSS